jgi:acyl-[acyl-carrier-protein]-phospholipid O-acyltransferase / long-chain-fatty-acid--[acyl-carrier-protein] ligase
MMVNPAATLCEGYGITECAPLFSINRVEAPKLGTIGKIMPSIEYVTIDPDSEKPVAIGKQGILLVRGPNIFAGYMQGQCRYRFLTV